MRTSALRSYRGAEGGEQRSTASRSVSKAMGILALCGVRR